MIYLLEKEYTSHSLAKTVSGLLRGREDIKINSVSADSRDKSFGGLFIALRGEKFDGHTFIGNALENGFSCVIADHYINTGEAACIVVGDTVKALGDIARDYMNYISPVTVAVTGSVGKTTTKQMIYSVLSEKWNTHKTEGNFNNQIGLPYTIFGLKKENQAAVLELGMSMRGEISYLSKICNPDIAVITNIGSSHLEYLGSREGIRDAKLEIRDGLKKNGALFLNGNEPLLCGIDNAFYVMCDEDKYFCKKNPDVLLSDITKTENGGCAFDVTAFGRKIEKLSIPAAGKHNAYDAAIAAGVSVFLGFDENEIRAGLSNFKNTGSRQNIFKRGDITVIEDCYNASPESVSAAVDVLAGYKDVSDLKKTAAGSKTIIVLGDMKELGENSKQLHKKTGSYVADKKIDILITYGCDALDIAKGALENGMPEENVISFENIADPVTISAFIKDIIKSGDIILFKASRAVAFERVINRIF